MIFSKKKRSLIAYGASHCLNLTLNNVVRSENETAHLLSWRSSKIQAKSTLRVRCVFCLVVYNNPSMEKHKL